jgi:hypothetical protein
MLLAAVADLRGLSDDIWRGSEPGGRTDFMDLRHLDPKLASALQTSGEPVSVFARLAVTGRHAQQEAAAVIERVARETGITPKFNFRDLDQVLHVSAEGAFIKELLKQSEVVAASPVPEVSSAMIPPINVRPVEESSIDRPVQSPAPKK